MFVLVFVLLPLRVSQFSLLPWLLVFPLRCRGDVRALPLLSQIMKGKVIDPSKRLR